MHSVLKISALANNHKINGHGVKTWFAATLIFLRKNVLSVKESHLSTYWRHKRFVWWINNVRFSFMWLYSWDEQAATSLVLTPVYCRNGHVSKHTRRVQCGWRHPLFYRLLAGILCCCCSKQRAVRALRDFVSSPFAHHWLASYRTKGLGVAGLRIGSGTWHALSENIGLFPYLSN